MDDRLPIFDAEPEEDDEPPPRLSFFSEAEGAEKQATDMAWRLYLRDSVTRGFEVPRGQFGTLSPELAAIQPGDPVHAKPLKPSTSLKKEPLMSSSQADDLTERERKILAAHREYVAKNGEAPSRKELAKLTGITAPNPNALDSKMYGACRRLVDRGLVPGRAPGRPVPTKANATPAPEKSPAKKKTPRVAAPPQRVATKSQPVGDEDPLLTEMRSRREALASKLARIDAAIAAFEGL